MKSTITDVATRAGVSIATVSRLINNVGIISDETRTRVEEAIRELEYAPKPKRARRTRRVSESTPTLPLAFLRIGNFESQGRSPVTENLTEALHRCAHAQGRVLTVHQVDIRDQRKVRDLIGDAEGILLRTGSSKDISPEVIRWLEGIPTVQALGNDRGGRQRLDRITPDNNQIGALAADYLLKAGCTKLVFAATHQIGDVGLERCAAFVRAARRAGIKPAVFFQVTSRDSRRLEDALSPFQADSKVLTSPHQLIQEVSTTGKVPVGLFMPSDLELALVLPQLQLVANGFHPDSKAIGCDHEVRCFSGLDPVPATLDLQLENIAQRLILRLLDRIALPDSPLVHIQVSPEVVVP